MISPEPQIYIIGGSGIHLRSSWLLITLAFPSAPSHSFPTESAFSGASLFTLSSSGSTLRAGMTSYFCWRGETLKFPGAWNYLENCTNLRQHRFSLQTSQFLVCSRPRPHICALGSFLVIWMCKKAGTTVLQGCSSNLLRMPDRRCSKVKLQLSFSFSSSLKALVMLC